jgi:uncharacterized protein (UPF0332 family)
MTDEKKALIAYRLERADEALDEAQLLFEKERLCGYVNRLYYACFYAVSSLLLTKEFSTSKHGHLRSLMHREFVKTGIISAELGKHFDLLFNNRQKGDYGDFIKFDKDEVADWFTKTEQFVNRIKTIIEKL